MRNLGISALVAGAVVLAGCGKQQPIQAKQNSGPVQVRVAPVVARDVQRIVESVGTLYPFDETVVSAEIDGRVDDVKIDLWAIVFPRASCWSISPTKSSGICWRKWRPNSSRLSIAWA